MKVSSILVMSVIIKLRDRISFRNIFSLYMKVSSILVISVILDLLIGVLFRDIFSQSMKVSSILVISVIIKLHNRVTFRRIFSESTISTDHQFSFCPLSNITIVSSLFNEIHLYPALLSRLIIHNLIPM